MWQLDLDSAFQHTEASLYHPQLLLLSFLKRALRALRRDVEVTSLTESFHGECFLLLSRMSSFVRAFPTVSLSSIQFSSLSIVLVLVLLSFPARGFPTSRRHDPSDLVIFTGAERMLWMCLTQEIDEPYHKINH